MTEDIKTVFRSVEEFGDIIVKGSGVCSIRTSTDRDFGLGSCIGSYGDNRLKNLALALTSLSENLVVNLWFLSRLLTGESGKIILDFVLLSSG